MDATVFGLSGGRGVDVEGGWKDVALESALESDKSQECVAGDSDGS